MARMAIAILVSLSLIGLVRWYNRPDNGIHALGTNVCLLEGECLIINWDATEHEAELALRKWQNLKWIARR